MVPNHYSLDSPVVNAGPLGIILVFHKDDQGPCWKGGWLDKALLQILPQIDVKGLVL